MGVEGLVFFVVDHAFEGSCRSCVRADEGKVSEWRFVDMVCSADGADFHLEGVSQSTGLSGVLGEWGGLRWREGELSFVAEEGSAVCHLV